MRLQTEVARRLAGPTGLQFNMEFIFGHMRLAALRVASAVQDDLPQGDQLVSLRVGRGNLCRLPLDRQHREGKPRIQSR
jgi:hypothetical protein